MERGSQRSRQYLKELGDIRATRSGTGETSYYPALANLLNAVGERLKPKVCCVIQLQNRGAGMPDGGLFTAEQLRSKTARANPEKSPLDVLPPARGVIEVKAPSQDLASIVASEQVGRYWQRYGLVLVTNYRAFALIGRSPAGQPVRQESFTLAETEDAFWRAAARPLALTDETCERFEEYLHRVLLHNAPLASPQDVAALLASYARDALARIGSADLPALTGLRAALESALGLTFDNERGERFFRSTLVQTLFYGVFSAWVLWARRRRGASGQAAAFAVRESAEAYRADADRFDWHTAVWHLRVPMIRALFEQLATPARLGPLGLEEVLDWAAAALNRVDAQAFFAAFDEGHAVQYFYEPFLQAFDPELRRELGVWYTPTEIVDYQVERVDRVLREELDIPDGLADPRVVVLDPCCGTGAYVRSVLRRIARTLHERGGDGLTAQDLKSAALERVLGFEILPAPFVVAHLQIGLLLETLGAPLNDARDERVGVYLTNALTGWEPPKEPKTLLLFPEMAQERDAADHIKRRDSILVILGNPPYNGYAGVAVDEERDLSDAYRTARVAAHPQGQGLNDLYVRFFRMAERRIVEMNREGRGVVCFISNYSWLDGLSFTGLRERYLEAFDRISIDCLNGDKYKTGKVTPEGDPDPSVFSTEFNREGIQVGTAVALLVKGAQVRPDRRDGRVSFRHFWGKAKRAELLADTAPYQTLAPAACLGFPFLPARVSAGYAAWPALPDLFPVSFPGVKTSRDDFLVDTDRDRLLARLAAYFDPAVSHDELRRLHPGVLADTARFKGEATRDALRRRGFLPAHIVPYCYRPFDTRWLYWEPETKLLDEKRSDYFPQVFVGNMWIEARQKQTQDKFDRGYFTRVLADNFGNGLSTFFPLLLRSDGASLLEPAGARPNLSEAAWAYLDALGAAPEDLFFHVLAVLHAPAYRDENAGALRQDWPRVPLPGWGVDAASRRVSDGVDATSSSHATRRDAASTLRASAALGRRVAALLDSATPVPGVTCGALRDDLKAIAVCVRADGRPINPDAGDLDLTAGWGHAGQGGVTMPGRGKVEETFDAQRSLDVYLNATTLWRNVPEAVWNYTLGGYQVVKKWLSYRERPLLGRSLTREEVRHVTDTCRRLAALLALRGELDGNYTVDMQR